MITPSAVNRPCQVISIPKSLKMTGSTPMSIERSIALVVLHVLARGTRSAGQALQFSGVLRMCRVLAGHQGASLGNFSPKPPSGHPEGGDQAQHDQACADPDQIVAPVPLHSNASELALTHEAVLVTTKLHAFALLKRDRLGLQPCHRQRRWSGRRGVEG